MSSVSTPPHERVVERRCWVTHLPIIHQAWICKVVSTRDELATRLGEMTITLIGRSYGRFGQTHEMWLCRLTTPGICENKKNILSELALGASHYCQTYDKNQATALTHPRIQSKTLSKS